MKDIKECFADAREALTRIEEELETLAKRQIEMIRDVAKELDIVSDSSIRRYFVFDRIEIDREGDFSLIELGSCGDSDSSLGYLIVHQLVIDGQYEEFKDTIRAQFKVISDRKLVQKRAQMEENRRKLEASLKQLEKDIASLPPVINE